MPLIGDTRGNNREIVPFSCFSPGTIGVIIGIIGARQENRRLNLANLLFNFQCYLFTGEETAGENIIPIYTAIHGVMKQRAISDGVRYVILFVIVVLLLDLNSNFSSIRNIFGK
jgi:hypothetical protein